MKTEATTADQVANYILWSSHKSGSFLSNLKLQKLLYYVQAWHLAFFEKALFPEKFQAWVRGPVVPEVYYRFKNYRWRNIDEEVERPNLSAGTIAFIEEVLDEYGPLDTLVLEHLSHREAPWKEARGDLASDEPCRSPISETSMLACYRARLTQEDIDNLIQAEPEPVVDCPEAAVLET